MEHLTTVVSQCGKRTYVLGEMGGGLRHSSVPTIPSAIKRLKDRLPSDTVDDYVSGFSPRKSARRPKRGFELRGKGKAVTIIEATSCHPVTTTNHSISIALPFKRRQQSE